MGYQKILVPVSGKHHLTRASQSLEQALQIVREDGEICFLHCIDEMPHLITSEAYKKLVLEAVGEAEKLLDRLVDRVGKAGIAYNVHIVEGSPVAHIPSFAADNKCDVVVMFTDLDKLFTDTVTYRVLQNLSIPLLIVH